MFNENEYDRYKREAEIEAYRNGRIHKDGKFKKITLNLFFSALVATTGYIGYNYMEGEGYFQKKAVLAVFVEKSTQEMALDEENGKKSLVILKEEAEQEKRLDETMTTVIDTLLANKNASYSSKKDISIELDGMVDNFYTQKALPDKLNSMVDDFYSEEPLK